LLDVTTPFEPLPLRRASEAAPVESQIQRRVFGTWPCRTATGGTHRQARGCQHAEVRGSNPLRSAVSRLELLNEMRALGGDVVLIDGPELPQRIAAATDKAKIELALDGVGGSATQRLLDSIVPYGTVVVYSAMSGEPSVVGGPHLVFFSQRIQGLGRQLAPGTN
jgi:hypothetical protein